MPNRFSDKDGVEYEQLTRQEMIDAGCFGDVMSFGLNTKVVFRRVGDEEGALYYVDKMSKTRSPMIVASSFPRAQDLVKAEKASEEAEKASEEAEKASEEAEKASEEAKKELVTRQCAEVQDRFLEADGSALILANLTDTLFRGRIIVPHAMLSVDPEDPAIHLQPGADDKVVPRSHLLTSFVPGYSEPLTKQLKVIDPNGDKGKVTPQTWSERHKQGKVLRRSDLDLDPGSAVNKGMPIKKFLGEVFAFATITGCLDAVNNINLSNVGMVGNAETGYQTAVVDLGLALGWGFGGLPADVSLFKSTFNQDEAGRDPNAADPIQGFGNVMPFDRRVFFDLPRMIVPDLFNLDDPEIRAAFMEAVDNAVDDSSALQESIDQSLTQTTSTSAIQGEELKKRMGAYYTGSGEHNLARTLSARVKDAKCLVEKLRAVEHAAREKGEDPSAQILKTVEAHNRSVMIDFLASQRCDVSTIQKILIERKICSRDDFVREDSQVNGEIKQAISIVKRHDLACFVSKKVKEGLGFPEIMKALQEANLLPEVEAERREINELVGQQLAQMADHSQNAEQGRVSPSVIDAADIGSGGSQQNTLPGQEYSPTSAFAVSRGGSSQSTGLGGEELSPASAFAVSGSGSHYPEPGDEESSPTTVAVSKKPVQEGLVSPPALVVADAGKDGPSACGNPPQACRPAPLKLKSGDFEF